MIPLKEFILTTLKFAAKTGKIWLELKQESKAQNCWKEALRIWDCYKDLGIDNVCLTELRTLEFCLYCWIAESSLNMSNIVESEGCLLRAYDIINSLNQENALSPDDQDLMSSELSLKLYNVGIFRYKEKAYQEAYSWSEKSIQIAEKCKLVDKEVYAKILRMMTNCIIEIHEKSSRKINLVTQTKEDLNKALRLVELANSTHPSVNGRLLVTKLYWMLSQYEDGDEVYTKALEDRKLDADVHSSFLSIAIKYGRKDIVSMGYNKLKSLYSNSASIGNIHCIYLDYILNTLKDYNEAKKEMDSVIQSQKKNPILNLNVMKQMHYMSWQISIVFYDRKDYDVATDWFRRTLDIVVLLNDEGDGKAQTLRMIALCSYKSGNIDVALECANMSHSIDPNSLATNALLFEIYLSLNNDNMLNNIVLNMSQLSNSTEPDATSILEYLSRKAVDQGKDDTAENIFLRLLQSPTLHIDKVPALLKNAVKLTYSQGSEKGWDHKRLQKLLDFFLLGATFMKTNTLLDLYSGYSTTKITDELKWLIGVTWNCGVQCNRDGILDLAYKFFSEAYRLSKTLYSISSSEEVSRSIRDSLFASAGTFLLNARSDRYCVVMLDKTYKRLIKFKSGQVNSHSSNSNHMHIEEPLEENIELLIIQCMIVKRDPNVISYIHNVKGALGSSALEAIASSASNFMLPYEVEVDALKFALENHSKRLNDNISMDDKLSTLIKCISIFRKLITRSKSKDESFHAFETVHAFIKIHASLIGVESPWLEKLDAEIHWLVVESFNNGVYYWKLSKYDLSEKWMTMAISLIQYFIRKEEIEPKIVAAYSEVLGKMKESNNDIN